jgi:hypothetical protein
LTRRKAQQPRKTQPLSSGLLTSIAAAGVVILVGLAALFLLTGRSDSESRSASTPGAQTSQAAVSWRGITPPAYVLAASQDVQTAYRFAQDRPDVMMWMACYCGCGQHADHKSARNCFIKESTLSGELFDPHGAGCAMCVNIALDAKALTEQGRSLRDIRDFIDGKYGSMGGGTDTPLPSA